MEKVAKKSSKKKINWLSQIAQFLIGGVLGILIVSYFFRHDVQITLWSVLLVMGVAALSFIVGIILHETGHAIAGKLSGMEIMNLSYGPFIFAKTNGQNRFFVKLPAMGYIGRAMLRFPRAIPEEDMRKKMIRFIYGGPVSNLVVAIPLLALSFIYGWSGWFVFALVNIFLGLSNLGNVESKGAQTDGRVLSMIKGKQPGADLILVSYQILQEDPQGRGNWSKATAEKAKAVIERYEGWPLAASLLSTVGPYYYHTNPEAYLALAEGRSFLPRDKQAGILQDLTDISVATGYFYAGRLLTEPDMKNKLQLIDDQEPVTRHMRDTYMAMINCDKNTALTSIYAAEQALGEWHPLYLEGTSLKAVLQDLLDGVKSR
ncbi:M50 family metallopeptidase [Chryseomicrobium palamuruense]|uniref:M50 family metallopeptidase n=1 Tax=Chryseomicrobium palamuruense TaxID=682973 RepID=A0ABV8UW33_9BACL